MPEVIFVKNFVPPMPKDTLRIRQEIREGVLHLDGRDSLRRGRRPRSHEEVLRQGGVLRLGAPRTLQENSAGEEVSWRLETNKKFGPNIVNSAFGRDSRGLLALIVTSKGTVDP